MLVRGRSEPFANDNVRVDYITSLYRDIEDFWADSDSEYDAFMLRLRARGAEIFKKLTAGIKRTSSLQLWMKELKTEFR